MSLSSEFVQNSELFSDTQNMVVSSFAIWERLANLAKAQKKALKKAAQETGVSEGAISGWKKSFPTVDNLAYLADFYGVSVDFLLTGIHSTSLTNDEHSLIHIYRQLDETGKRAALGSVKGLVDALSGEKKGKATKTAGNSEPIIIEEAV